MPNLKIPNKLKPLLSTPKRFKIIIGGRGSAKSTAAADLLILKAQTEQAMVMCCREFQNSIEDSVHGLISEEIDNTQAQGFTVQASKIDCKGGGFRFRGLARNPESVKSAFGFKYCWVEEAQTISQESLKLLTPSIREAGSEIWMTANPRSRADAFSQRFIVPYEKELKRDGYYEDDLHLIIMINWRDNPWFPEELEQERQHDYEHLPRAHYDHIWEGAFNDHIENALIPPEWFDSAIDAHEKLGFKPSGAIIVGHDPSDEGNDSKGYAARHGSVVIDLDEMDTGDAADGIDWALSKGIQAQMDYFAWDCDGLGVALKREVSNALDGKKIEYFMFKGSESPESPDSPFDDHKGGPSKSNRDALLNKRAQYYWKLRERFYATYRAVEKGEYIDPEEMISLPSTLNSLEKLRSELCRIPIKPNNNGKIQIMSKIDMAKKPYQLPSPNLADALMMSMYSPDAVTEFEEINFAGWG